jgi:hypothetical protein
MAKECEHLCKCGFFQKYQSSSELACKGLIQVYCKGSSMKECKRLAFREEHGVAPPDEMMPSGAMLSTGNETNEKTGEGKTKDEETSREAGDGNEKPQETQGTA